MDAIYDFSRNIRGTTYDDLPSEVVDATKRLILDTLAVGIGGSAKEGVSELVDILKEWGGKEESSIWVYGDKLPSLNAALVNATMVHALDYDDTHDGAALHVGVVAVPTALALAERMGGIDGKKLITAIALAADLTSRLCLANTVSPLERGWHYTTLHGNFNAAAVAGKLLELDEETLVSAFGLAYHQAGGNMQCVSDGALAKRVGPGFSARNGIMAAVMAQRGITGARNVLQGRYGLFTVYHRGDYNPEVLTANLGRQWEVVNLSFKPYPCCRHNHPSVDAALALVREHHIEAGDVESITAYLGKGCMKVIAEPLDAKQNPSNIVDAQFSVAWTIASAIAHGSVGIAEFTPEAIKDETVLALSNKVTPKADEALSVWGVTPAIVEIKTKDGNVYSKRVDTPYGSPQNPMSMDAMATKLRDCASFAAKPVSQENLDKLIEMVSQLEKIRDMGQIVRLFT